MKKKILIVDDEQDMLDILDKILSNAGYEVAKAQRGEDAIGLARNQRPDLIILDVKMPGMDGAKVTDVLRDHRSTRDIPIIYLSSLVSEKQVEDGHVPGSKIGDMHFIPKSYSPDQIVDIVRKNIGSLPTGE